MKTKKVYCYAGSRAEEYPRNFCLPEEKIEILKIIRRWLEPGQRCFKVLGNDNRVYLLSYKDADNSWDIRVGKKPLDRK